MKQLHRGSSITVKHYRSGISTNHSECSGVNHDGEMARGEIVLTLSKSAAADIQNQSIVKP